METSQPTFNVKEKSQIAINSVFEFERRSKRWGKSNPKAVADLTIEELKKALKLVKNNYKGKAHTYWYFPLMLELKYRTALGVSATSDLKGTTKDILLSSSLEEALKDTDNMVDGLQDHPATRADGAI